MRIIADLLPPPFPADAVPISMDHIIKAIRDVRTYFDLGALVVRSL